MSKKLYVGNLPFTCTEESLQQLAGTHGNVTNVTVVKDKMTGRSRGFGFVEMGTAEEAQAAMSSLNGTQMDGRTLKIDLAQEREAGSGPRDRGSFGNSSRGSTSGGGWGGGGNRSGGSYGRD